MSKKSAKKTRRNFYVFTSLTGALTLTGGLLVMMAPDPLRPDAAATLAAVEGPDPMAAVYGTRVPVAIGRWKYIYVRHSRSASGSAATLARSTPAGLGDHFVIGNGNGCGDGEIQFGPRWTEQAPASPVGTGGSIDPSCISICLVGDFDHSAPTPSQLYRLTQLINSLQGQLRMAGRCLILLDQPMSPAGVGRHFPKSDFRGQLLP